GIRYRNVTGVQTCALPIFPGPKVEEPKLNFTNPFQSIITQAKSTKLPSPKMEAPKLPNTTNVTNQMKAQMPKNIPGPKVQTPKRSEERRVGKERRQERTEE